MNSKCGSINKMWIYITPPTFGQQWRKTKHKKQLRKITLLSYELPSKKNTLSLFQQNKKRNPPSFDVSATNQQTKKKLPLLSFLLPFAHLFTHPKTNPFLLFLGGFYSQGRGLQGATSRDGWTVW